MVADFIENHILISSSGIYAINNYSGIPTTIYCDQTRKILD